MYTEESENEVKEAAKIVEVVSDSMELKKHGINYIGSCPFHKEKTPSFYISPAKNIYKCFGCAKGGDPFKFLQEHENKTYKEALEALAAKYNITLVDEKDHVYIKPIWKNKTTLHPVFVKRFEDRGISQETIQRLRITDSKEFLPQRGKEVFVIQYNYFRNDELVNIKSRDINKNFKLHTGSELIFWNLDSLKGKKIGWITEGEDDGASLVQAGYWNDESGVVSVPNGASKSKNILKYIDNCIKDIEHIELWIIGVDDDIVGRKLREDIAERLGKDKCKFVTWNGKKDANEVLVADGINGVIECCSSPQNFPLEGVFTVDDISDEIDDMYMFGLDSGADLHIPDFELKIVKNYITTITGIPSMGKTAVVDYIVLNLLRYSQWKGAFYSPENRPIQLHFSNLARQLIGKHWEGNNRMTIEEMHLVKDYLNKKIWFIKPEKDFTLDSILKSVKALKLSYGIDFFVIDAWNKLEHKETDTHYVGRALDQLSSFCELYKLHCFLVAHPTKIGKNKIGEYEVPTLYDISGSANFFNKTDNGICVYRDFKTNKTILYIQKVKFSHWGSVGNSEYKFHIPSNRYYKEGYPDMKNWITGETNITQAKEDQIAPQLDVFYDTSNTDEPPF